MQHNLPLCPPPPWLVRFPDPLVSWGSWLLLGQLVQIPVELATEGDIVLLQGMFFAAENYTRAVYRRTIQELHTEEVTVFLKVFIVYTIQRTQLNETNSRGSATNDKY